jgi:hypothetical protein
MKIIDAEGSYLTPGYKADLVLLDKELQVKGVLKMAKNFVISKRTNWLCHLIFRCKFLDEV